MCTLPKASTNLGAACRYIWPRTHAHARAHWLRQLWRGMCTCGYALGTAAPSGAAQPLRANQRDPRDTPRMSLFGHSELLRQRIELPIFPCIMRSRTQRRAHERFRGGGARREVREAACRSLATNCKLVRARSRGAGFRTPYICDAGRAERRAALRRPAAPGAKKRVAFDVRELNPGLPRDRRGY